MATHTELNTPARTPLTRERVLRAAVDLADQAGIDALSMRRLAQRLGVEAMSLYNHVRNKNELLDGIVDVVVGEIEECPVEGDWKAAIRQRVHSARTVLLRHRWALRVIESRAHASPAVVRYMDSVIGILREGGFSIDLTHHALHVLGSRVLGFTQDLFDDSPDPGTTPEAAAMLSRALADRYPYVTELATAVSHDGGLGGCDDDVEFEFGLELILDALARRRDTETNTQRVEQLPVEHSVPQRASELDPLVVTAIRELQHAAVRAVAGAVGPDARLNRNLVRQLRATFLAVVDAALEDPQQRAARRAALPRRRSRRSDVK